MNKIRWQEFELCNKHRQTAFENLCLALFKRKFLDGSTTTHSNPNNPGIEIEPVIDKTSKERISFQAKYFEKISYDNIKHSADMTVKYYSGKLDVVYLYCNKNVNSNSTQFKAIKQLLRDVSIELRLITNQEILDEVSDYPGLSKLYFDNHGITDEWFKEQLRISLDSFGPRYNAEFNISTNSESILDLFAHADAAVSKINAKKTQSIEKLKETAYSSTNSEFINTVYDIVESMALLEDIQKNSICDCLLWADRIKTTHADTFFAAGRELAEKRIELAKETDKKSTNNNDLIRQRIRELELLEEIPDLLEFGNMDRLALQGQILIVTGEAGCGKSQLFSNAAKKSIDAGRYALLLSGHFFLDDAEVTRQIINCLHLACSFEDLLEILESLGEHNDEPVVIYIDALNESGNKRIWEVGLTQIIRRLEKYKHVRIAVSVRSGFEPLVFSETIQGKINSNLYPCIHHRGFEEEPIDALQSFLNYYEIPFSPSYVLQHEMQNPLFLTYFCQTYEGEDINVFALFSRIIQKANIEAQRAIDFDGTKDMLTPLLNEIALWKLNNETTSISKENILSLKFWETYGLSTQKLKFLTALERFGILITHVIDNTEFYYIGYNLLDDYICAKCIITLFPEKSDLKEYLKHDLLGIDGGQIKNYENESIFIAVCGLFAEKFREECIDVIDGIQAEWQRDSITDEYIRSFAWRNPTAICEDDFISATRKYNVRADSIWEILIENSAKLNHPLNSQFLHRTLIDRPLNERDCIWTIYINHNVLNDENRIGHIISYFENGKQFDGMTKDRCWLLLLLFSWLLTSSNRYLRDRTSKAVIELLKCNFELCLPLLQSFESVNDPYVLQRLYGIVFGACMKRMQIDSLEFTKLTEYVYKQIFCQGTVYPDILLRDYARLIVERYLYEFPDNQICIDVNKVHPPYSSFNIPKVDPQNYNEMPDIEFSMRPNVRETPGMYGDFGRYVFQAVLSHFSDIDIANAYHYAMQFIRDRLGYRNDLFEEYDKFGTYYGHDRSRTKKVERIGKKYQWITMYHILAKVSDNHNLKEWGDEEYPFEGAWEPFVRDFDPTLNTKLPTPSDLPVFNSLPDDSDEFLTEGSDEAAIRNWTKAPCPFFESHGQKILLTDSDGIEWVLLSHQEKVKNYTEQQRRMSHSRSARQEIWSMSNAYIVKQIDWAEISSLLEHKPIRQCDLPDPISVYQLYNREYVWSPAYRSIFRDCWVDFEVETGEFVTEQQDGFFPQIVMDDLGDSEVIFEPKYQKWSWREPIKKTVGKLLPAYSHMLWETEYDTSQDDTVSINYPCKELIDFLHLEQKLCDGYFYSQDGVLVAFDGRLTENCKGLAIRKDYLERFLDENNMMIFWGCIGEKQYFMSDYDQIWHEWDGVFVYSNGQIVGAMKPVISEEPMVDI